MRIENDEVGHTELIELLEHISAVVGFSVGVELLAPALINKRHDNIDSLGFALKNGQDPQKVYILVIG